MSTAQRVRALNAIAYRFYQERTGHYRKEPCDRVTDWCNAEKFVHGKVHQIQRAAYEHWKKRGPNGGDELGDWKAAEELILWEQWAAVKLRPYLAIQAEAEPEALDDVLNRYHNDLGLGGQKTLAMIAVLDGSPEFSRARFANPLENGQSPEEQIETKDARFYEHCCHCLALYGGQLLDQERMNLREDAVLKPRHFQDSCAVAFMGQNAVLDGLAAAIHLRRVLASFNDDHNLPWYDRFFARIAIGGDYASAAASLSFAQRDEIVAEPSILQSLGPTQRLLFADGVRAGVPGKAHH